MACKRLVFRNDLIRGIGNDTVVQRTSTCLLLESQDIPNRIPFVEEMNQSGIEATLSSQCPIAYTNELNWVSCPFFVPR